MDRQGASQTVKKEIQTMYQLTTATYNGARTTQPQPTLGLAIKSYFANLANYRLNLDWVSADCADSMFIDHMYFDGAKAMEEGRFKLKLIQVGDEVFWLSRNPEETGGPMEDIAKALNHAQVTTAFDIHVIEMQLTRSIPVDLLGKLK